MKHLLTFAAFALLAIPASAFEHRSGLKIDLASGMQVRELEDWEFEGDATVFVITTRDPKLSRNIGGELCRIGLALDPERSPLTQNELNDVEAGDDTLNAYRTIYSPHMKVLSAMPFMHGDIVGSELVASSKHAPGLTMLVSTMQTPKGRTIVSCSASHAEFYASRSIFEMIRAGVTPPS